MRRHGILKGQQKAKAKPTNRTKSWELLLAMDNQLTLFFGCGLQRFCMCVGPQELDGELLLKLPHINWAADEGSENIAALHFCQRHLHANITYWNDPSHGVSRDLEHSLKGAGLYLHQLMCCVTWRARRDALIASAFGRPYPRQGASEHVFGTSRSDRMKL